MINDILECKDENDIEAILFSADFEKAFALVEHSFIISTLETFGFGPDFIQWVKAFFKNVENYVMKNGRSTGYSPRKRHLTRGPSLYIHFRFGPEGIIIDETEIKFSAYADDGSFFVTDVQLLQMIF